MVVIKWTNKFSGETGYVESISSKEKHFNNAYEFEDAKQYSETSAKGILTNLAKFGEAENNDFELIKVE